MFRDSQTSHLAVTGELRPRGATSGLYRESSGTDQRAILWQNILQLIEVYLKENLGTLSPAAQATATKVRMLGGLFRRPLTSYRFLWFSVTLNAWITEIARLHYSESHRISHRLLRPM